MIEAGLVSLVRPWAKPGVGSGVESFPQPGAAPSTVSGICAVGKVFVACSGGSDYGGFLKGGQQQGVAALRFHRGRARYASKGQPPR
jgi:hypothetical protein